MRLEVKEGQRGCLLINDSYNSDIKLADRMPKLEPVAMRLEVKEGQRGCLLINDSYNSDINSLDIALDFMNRRESKRVLKKTLILSDMFQTGTTPEALYAQVSDLAVKRGIEKFIGIGTELMAQADKIQIADKQFFASVPHFLSSEALCPISCRARPLLVCTTN